MAPYPIIHVNGFPGTGKLTISQCLVRLLSGHAKLVHNHLLINPADAVLHRTQPGYQHLRKSIRSAIFTALANEPATYETAYIFTDFQTTNEIGSGVCAEFSCTAEARGCLLIPIVLTCLEEVNLERLVTLDRSAHQKLMDVELLQTFRRGAPLFRFEHLSSFLELDVTSISAEEAAEIIFKHILTHCPDLREKILHQQS